LYSALPQTPRRLVAVNVVFVLVVGVCIALAAGAWGKGSDAKVAKGNGTPNPPLALENFKMIFHESFSVPKKRGTMGSKRDPMKVIYSGENGTRWVTYPNTFRDTYNKRRYRSDRVLSVHDGYLDFFLHRVNGKPAGANPSPLISGNQQYQTYGRYSARLKVQDKNLSEYYIAWLLWPREDSDWQSSESDFPEGSLKPGRRGVYAYSQYGPGKTEPFGDPSIDMHEWHTYTQDWTPTQRRYYVDNKLIGVTTTPIFKRPQRWQLQIETKGRGNHRGHVLVDWAAVYSL
jgi:hypothetical protein